MVYGNICLTGQIYIEGVEIYVEVTGYMFGGLETYVEATEYMFTDLRYILRLYCIYL
jgi:hypothetical protein